VAAKRPKNRNDEYAAFLKAQKGMQSAEASKKSNSPSASSRKNTAETRMRKSLGPKFAVQITPPKSSSKAGASQKGGMYKKTTRPSPKKK